MSPEPRLETVLSGWWLTTDDGVYTDETDDDTDHSDERHTHLDLVIINTPMVHLDNVYWMLI